MPHSSDQIGRVGHEGGHYRLPVPGVQNPKRKIKFPDSRAQSELSVSASLGGDGVSPIQHAKWRMGSAAFVTPLCAQAEDQANF